MASTGVHAEVLGPVSGQLAVGSNIVQYHVEAGGVVNHGDPAATARPKRLPRVVVKGRDRELIGRSGEVRMALTALGPATPVEFYGVAGVGKSVLLKHLGHRPPPELASAVVYQECGVETLDETLQFLFDAFYETPPLYKATEGEMRRLLAEVTGFVALDDVNFERTELEALLDALPQATFLLASERRRLWGQGKAVAVRGLAEAEAVTLLERRLGRSLGDDERVAAADACRAVEGHPLRVEQLAGVVDELGESVAEVAAAQGDGRPVDVLVDRLKSRLGPDQLEVLAALGAVLGASLSAEHLAAVVGCDDIAGVVEPLLRSGLVQSHSPRYSLREARAAVGDAADWARRVADHLADAADADADPEPVAAESGAILTLLGRLRDDGDHRALLRLSRATERPLMLGRRWGAWRVALDDQLTASRALGDRRSEAWALHQRGTRALCLGDEAAARADLAEALRIREAIGDRTGAAASRHNLRFLDPPPPPPPPPTQPPPAPPWPPRPATAPPRPARPDRRTPVGVWWAAGAVVLLLLLALGATTVVGSGDKAAFDAPTTTAAPAAPPPSVAPAVTAGGVTAIPGALRFADQTVGTASPTQTVTLTGSGQSAVRPGGVSIEGPGRDSFSMAASTCSGAVLPPGGSCTVDVIFHPPAAGDRTAALRLGMRDGPAVALSGQGVEGVSTPTGMPGPTPTRPGGGPVTGPRSQTTSTTAVPTVVTAPAVAEADLAVVVEQCVAPDTCDGRVKVTNNGRATASGVKVTYQVTGLTSSVTDPRCSGGSCSLGTLTRDEVKAVDIRLFGTSGVLSGTASADQTDPDDTNNEAKRSFTVGPG